MAGYAGRKKPAEGRVQNLFAKALAIEDESSNTVVFVTLDLIGVPQSIRRTIAERLERELMIPGANLVMNASHTHSGPSLRTVPPAPPKDESVENTGTQQSFEYTQKLEQDIFAVIAQALARKEASRLTWNKARCGFAMNRRRDYSLPAGHPNANLAPNPDGPVDHEVPALRIEAPDGSLKAVLFGYACHNTCLGFYNFCGDYAGYAQEYLQQHRPGFVAMFLMGCGADQNPYPRRTMELAQTHGKSLATSVEAALTTNMQRLVGPIRAAYREIQLAYDKLPTKEQLLEEQKSTDKWKSTHATRVLQRTADEGPLKPTYPYPVQVVRLGNDLTWVTLGGEVVVDYSLRLKQDIKDSIVWVSGYTNDVMAYIPSLRIWQEGGYEGGGAMIYGTHPTRWSDKTEEHIVGTVMELRKAVE